MGRRLHHPRSPPPSKPLQGHPTPLRHVELRLMQLSPHALPFRHVLQHAASRKDGPRSISRMRDHRSVEDPSGGADIRGADGREGALISCADAEWSAAVRAKDRVDMRGRDVAGPRVGQV